jgi:hypothetical protein
MFGRGRKARRDGSEQARGGPSGQAGEPVIAALLLEGDTFDVAALERKLRGATVAGRTPTDFRIDNGILTLQLDDELIAVAPMPVPYPWSDLQGPCATSWLWPRGTSATSVEKHRTHVLVTAIGGNAPPVERRLALTQVVAAAAELPGVMGVYWPEGTLVHYPPLFVKMARAATSPKGPPLYLWVDFRVGRNPDGTSALFTTGLRPLGRLEVEVPRIAMPPGELRDWAVNIAYYLLENGDRVKDGDTIGMSATQKIRIRHRPGSFGQKGTVMQLQA